MEDTRKDIPLYAFLDKYVSFRKDENNNKGQNRNKNPAGFFLSGEMETLWRALEKILKQFLYVSLKLVSIKFPTIFSHLRFCQLYNNDLKPKWY